MIDSLKITKYRFKRVEGLNENGCLLSNISGSFLIDDMQYSAEQMETLLRLTAFLDDLETLLTAFLNDLELIGLDVKLGDLPVQDKIIFILGRRVGKFRKIKAQM